MAGRTRSNLDRIHDDQTRKLVILVGLLTRILQITILILPKYLRIIRILPK